MANTQVNVFRGTLTTDLGEVADDNGATDSPTYAAIPFALTEKRRRIYDPASGEQRTIRWSVGRAQDPSLDIKRDDRIVDLTDGRIYAVDSTTRLARNGAGAQSLILDLRHL